MIPVNTINKHQTYDVQKHDIRFCPVEIILLSSMEYRSIIAEFN